MSLLTSFAKTIVAIPLAASVAIVRPPCTAITSPAAGAAVRAPAAATPRNINGHINYPSIHKILRSIKGLFPVNGVGAALAVGAQTLYSSIFPSNQNQQPSIEAYNSVIINAAGDVNLSSDQLKAYQDSLRDSKKLAQETVNALAPARLTPNSEIEIEGLPNLKVESQFINTVPESYQPPVQEEREEPYSNIDIMIFASDQDRSETGWAGIVPELFTKRVKFVLGDDIQPNVLHGTKKIKADIVVKERFN
ncbi:hypothetical protein LGR50_04220, partial [Acinetobacter baumannii]|nr:hypothetical protein [Acinetobacter baumannii]